MTGWTLLGLGALALVLTPIVSSDLTVRRIPNAWNLALAGTGLTAQLLVGPPLRALGRCALAALLTALLFLGLGILMRLLKRRSTLGGGDVKFLIAASQWVGFAGSTWVFVLATLLTLVWSLALAPWRGFQLQREIPFAPALAAGLVATYLALGVGG